jgi:hypothetical protein
MDNADDNAGCENQKKRDDRIGGAHGSGTGADKLLYQN